MLRLLVRKKHLSQRRRRRLFLYWLVALILIAAIFANVFKLFSNLTSWWGKPAGSRLTFEKFEGEKITGVIVADPLILATFDPQELKVDIFEMPPNLYLEVPEKGFFLASKVYNLGEVQGDGAKLLAQTLLINFSIPVDFYLDTGSFSVDEEKILEMRDKLSGAGSLLWIFQLPKSTKVLKTNFTLFDQFKLFWQLRKVRKDKFNYQLMTLDNFEELILPNGDKVVKVSQDGITPETGAVFHDLRIAKEGLTVAVYNAAGKSGLAQTAAKICQNLGAQCIVGGEAEQVLSVTKILVRGNVANSFTVKRLLKTFGGKAEKQTGNGFADIVILAGEDLGKLLTF